MEEVVWQRQRGGEWEEIEQRQSGGEEIEQGVTQLHTLVIQGTEENDIGAYR